MKKTGKIIFVIIIFLPLLFIDPKHSHDWGDDFAQYIHQAINIVDGKAQSETGYIFNQEFFLGPPAYPVGFPLMLVPVYILAGNDIFAFWCFMSGLLILLALITFIFHSQFFSFLSAFALTAVFIYNPWMLAFKAEVVSEIPFTIFLLLSFIFYSRVSEKKTGLFIATGITTAFAILIRSIGWVIVLAIILDQSIHIIKTRRTKTNVNQLLIRSKNLLCFILPATVIPVLMAIIIPMPGGYLELADWQNFKHVFIDHLSYNVAVYHAYFTHYDVGEYKFILLLTASAMLSFFMVGLGKKLIENIEVYDLFTLLYILVIIIYPHGNAGFRFLLPVFPFMMNHVIYGFKSITINSRITKKQWGIVLFLTVLLQYNSSLRAITKCRNCELPGPYEKESVEAFKYIRSNTPSKARILFAKPRALALYTERCAYANKENDIVQNIIVKADSKRIDYYLIHQDLTDDSVKILVQNNPAIFHELWRNSKFVFYRRSQK